MKKVFVWGGTGNFKVVKEIIESNNQEVIGFFDNNTSIINPYPQIPYLGGKDSFLNWIKDRNVSELSCVVAIGGNYGKERLEIQEFLSGFGVSPQTIRHKTAYISDSAILGKGTQVYAMASICVEAVTGKSCIINTAATVDHECILGDGVFIGPGAKLAGSVRVGNFADIYTGAVILPRINIGESAVIGAGSVVIEDVSPFTVVAGNPAKIIKDRKK